jgi:hypothetical protein
VRDGSPVGHPWVYAGNGIALPRKIQNAAIFVDPDEEVKYMLLTIARGRKEIFGAKS